MPTWINQVFMELWVCSPPVHTGWGSCSSRGHSGSWMFLCWSGAVEMSGIWRYSKPWEFGFASFISQTTRTHRELPFPAWGKVPFPRGVWIYRSLLNIIRSWFYYGIRGKKGKDLSPWRQLCMECQWEKDLIPCDVFILLPPYRQTQLIVHDVHLHSLHYLSHPWPSEVLPSCQWMQSIRTLIAFCLSTARYLLPLKMENVQKYLYMLSFGRSLNFCNGRKWENQNMLNKSPSLEMLLWQQHFLVPVKRACAFKTSCMCHDFLTKVFPWLLWFFVTVWISSADVEQWIWMCCVCPPNLLCAAEVKKVL